MGERIIKGENLSSTKRSATPKQLEVLVHLLGSISSENFSCSISIAKFE